MQQIDNYVVKSLDSKFGAENILSTEDQKLVDTFTLTSLPFYSDRYRVDVSFYTFDDFYVETVKDIKTYRIYGTVQRDGSSQVALEPVQDALNAGYKGDIILKYDIFNNLYATNNDKFTEFFVSDISTDRTELRAKCLTLEGATLKSLTDSVYSRLNLQKYFSEVYLEFFDVDVTSVGINILTEVIDGETCITLKTYEPLPESVVLKSRFRVLEKVCDSIGFQVDREVQIVEDPVPQLRRPNFNVAAEEHVVTTTDYMNYNQLFSYPVSSSYYELQNLVDRESCTVAVDYEKFEDFIHFSSAQERLENFRYKMQLIEQYQDRIAGSLQKIEGYQYEIDHNDAIFGARSIDYLQKHIDSEKDSIRLSEKEVKGIVLNFDHYEKYLYFENGPAAWPKEDGVRPYKNVPCSQVSTSTGWWKDIISRAEAYDDTNEDILIGTIPFAIREDPRNEAYLIFIHMIGQHFDNEWIYAKAIADKYKADNRLDFGISKDLVREAIRDLGINLYESNQNLNSVFEQCNPDGTYNTGSETSVTDFNRVTDLLLTGSVEFQPMFYETYRKETYKRIYHNLPLLLKSKGTERGLRALINCFGIPDGILELEVKGGLKYTNSPGEVYFGPVEGTTSSLQRVRLDATSSLIPIVFGPGSGSEYAATLHGDISTMHSNSPYTDDSHQVILGFNLNKQADNGIRAALGRDGFDMDDIIGDIRNHKENYGKVLDNIRVNLLQDLRGPLRSPAAILRLVKYFDSMLFRSVKEFLPARVDVSVGAVVEDSLLHRNRYRGVTPTASGHVGYTIEGIYQDQHRDQNTEVEGILDIVAVTGSDVGHLFENVVPVLSTHSFEVDGREIERTGSVPVYEHSWSTGKYTGSKAVFDDRPVYNGEFEGSEIVASDAEVLDNPYKRGGASANTYDILAMFLNPSPVFCDIVGTSHSLGWIHEYWVRNYSGSVYETKMKTTTSWNTPFEYIVSGSGQIIVAESKSIGLQHAGELPAPVSCFIGWTSGSTKDGSAYYSYGTKKEDKGSASSIRKELVPFSHIDDSGNLQKCQIIQYATASLRERLRLQVHKVTEYDVRSLNSASYYYNYKNDEGLVVSYTFQSRASGSTISNYLVDNFDVEVTFKDTTTGNTSTQVFNVSDLSTVQSGSFVNGCGIKVFTTSSVNINRMSIVKYGIKKVTFTSTENPKPVATYPVLRGGRFFDADWTFTYSGTLDARGWNYDNERSRYGWYLTFESGNFVWNWNNVN